MNDHLSHWAAIQPKPWYLKQGNQVQGPLSEAVIRSILLQYRYNEDTMVQQGSSGFFPAAKMRDLFEKLDQEGWYIKLGDTTHGPYTGEKIKGLLVTGFFPKREILIRRGHDQPWQTWKKTARQLRLAANNKDSNTQLEPATSSAASDSVLPLAVVVADHEPPASFAPKTLPSERSAGETNETTESEIIASDQASPSCPICGASMTRNALACANCIKAGANTPSSPRQRKKPTRSWLPQFQIESNFIGKGMLLIFSAATCGYFFSKWLLVAVVWPTFHNSADKQLGWFWFAVGLTVLGISAPVAYGLWKQKGGRRFVVTGILGLAITGGLFFLPRHQELRIEQAEQDRYNEKWASGLGDYESDL